MNVLSAIHRIVIIITIIVRLFSVVDASNISKELCKELQADLDTCLREPAFCFIKHKVWLFESKVEYLDAKEISNIFLDDANLKCYDISRMSKVKYNQFAIYSDDDNGDIAGATIEVVEESQSSKKRQLKKRINPGVFSGISKSTLSTLGIILFAIFGFLCFCNIVFYNYCI